MTEAEQGLRSAVLAILNYPGESSRLRTAVGSILYDRLLAALDESAPPSPPVAPEPAQENSSPPPGPPEERREASMASTGGAAGDPTSVPNCNNNCGHCRNCKAAGIGHKSPDRGVDASDDWDERQRAAEEADQETDPFEEFPITHEKARELVRASAPFFTVEKDLLRYIDQQQAAQEQSEREAASLQQELSDYKRATGEQMATLNDVSARNASLHEQLRDAEEERDFLRGDRDAERAQKEALRVELELMRDIERTARAMANPNSGPLLYQLGDFREQLTKLDALRKQPAEAAPVTVAAYCCHTCFRVYNGDLLLDRMILCSTCGNKRCPRANDHLQECSGSNEPGQPGAWGEAAPVAKQPAEAAPVAKVVAEFVAEREEQLSEAYDAPLRRDARRAQAANMAALQAVAAAAPVAKAEAPSEPAGWAPAEGELVRVVRSLPSQAPECIAGHEATVKYVSMSTDNGGTPGCTVAMKEALGDWKQGEQWWIDLVDLEPAPQPPATTGGAKSCQGSGACIHPDGHWYPCSSEPDRPVMMGELVAALVKLVNRGGIILPDSPGSWFGRLAEELESGKP